MNAEVVLVRPQGPRNVGSILRLTTNFGPAPLTIVRPVRPSLLAHPDFEQMSHGVPEAAEAIRVADSLDVALADATASYGFTARARDHRSLRDWRDVRDELVARASAPGERVALVFGSEENGLTREETNPLHELVRFPTTDEHTSLNLAMAVGIVLSTIFFAEAPRADSDAATAIRGEARAFLREQLKDVLGARATSEAAARDLRASIQRVFDRAPLESRDARAWHLLARALGSRKSPADFGLVPADRIDPGDRIDPADRIDPGDLIEPGDRLAPGPRIEPGQQADSEDEGAGARP